MRATACPTCGAALSTAHSVSRCPGCKADWHYHGFPDHCPGCDARVAPMATACAACGQTMDALALELVDLRAALRAQHRRRRWLVRGGVALALVAAATAKALGFL